MSTSNVVDRASWNQLVEASKGPVFVFFWSGASGPSLLTKEEIQYQ
jgi:hypothetical protein